MTAADIRVMDVPERSRLEALVDGEIAGFTEYRRRPGLIAFVQTVVDPRFEGHGKCGRGPAGRSPAKPALIRVS
jgi:predicted GNAT family acetyltransferase